MLKMRYGNIVEDLKDYYLDNFEKYLSIFRSANIIKNKLGINPLTIKRINRDIKYLKYKNKTIKNLRDINLAIMTTWNTPCGVALLPSKYLAEEYLKKKIKLIILAEKTSKLIDKDQDFVYRCWHRSRFDYKRILKIIIRNKINILHIEGDASIYRNKNNFLRLLIELKKRGIKIILSIHILKSYIDNYACKIADFVIIHNPALIKFIPDYKKYKDKIIYLNLGVPNLRKTKIKTYFNEHLKSKKIISTFGFIALYKNLPTLLRSIDLVKKKVPNILLMLLISEHPEYPRVLADNEYKKIFNKIRRYHLEKNVFMYRGFLNDNDLISLLNKSNILIHLNNKNSPNQSGSAKILISTKKPLIVTNTLFFRDMDKGVIKVKPNDYKDVANKIIKILNDRKLRNRLKKESNEYVKDNNIKVITDRYIGLYLK